MAFSLSDGYPQRVIDTGWQGKCLINPGGKPLPTEADTDTLRLAQTIQARLCGVTNLGQSLGQLLTVKPLGSSQNGISDLQLDRLILRRIGIGDDVEPGQLFRQNDLLPLKSCCTGSQSGTKGKKK